MEKPSVSQPPRTARRVLAENLRIARLLRNLSQEAFAELVNLDRSYISGIEHAERNVGLDTLEKIAFALDTTLPDLFRGPDPQQLAEQLLEHVRKSVRGGGPLRIKEERAAYW